MTIGRDGAVFFWVYEPVPFPVYQHPKRFGNIPGKRRKRKAPDTDPEDAEQQGPEAEDKAANHTEASDSESDSEESSSSKESDPPKEGTAAASLLASADSEPAGGVAAEAENLKHQKARETEEAHTSTADEGSTRSANGEAGRQRQASTSGRSEDGSAQSTSFAGPAPPETAATYMSYFCPPV